MRVGAAKQGGQIQQPGTQAVGHLFAAQHKQLQTGPLPASLIRLAQHMVDEGGHADEDVRLDLLYEVDVSLSAECLAAAGAQHEGAEAQPGMMRQPEGQMRRIGEEIHVPVLFLRTACEHQTDAADVQIVQIVLGIEKRHGVR